jgi:hypothetical protein
VNRWLPGWDHRFWAFEDGVDDFGVVDLGRRYREVGVARLALGHDQRDSFAGHLDRVRVPELMRGEATANAGGLGSAMELSTEPGWSARAPLCRAAQDAEQRAGRHGSPQLERWLELDRRSAVHPDLATPVTGRSRLGF